MSFHDKDDMPAEAHEALNDAISEIAPVVASVGVDYGYNITMSALMTIVMRMALSCDDLARCELAFREGADFVADLDLLRNSKPQGSA